MRNHKLTLRLASLMKFACAIALFTLLSRPLTGKPTEGTGIFLINAATGEELIDPAYTTLNLYDLPQKLSIVADPSCCFYEADQVESVRFILNGKVIRTENQAPYAMAGNKGTQYYAYPFAPGEYHLLVEYYDQKKAQGNLLGAEEIYFTFIDVAPIEFSVTPIVATVEAGEQLAVNFEIFVGATDIDYTLELSNNYGPSWLALPDQVQEGSNEAVILADNLQPGTYALLNPIHVVLLSADQHYSQSVQLEVQLTVTEGTQQLVAGFTIIDAATDRAGTSYITEGTSANYYDFPHQFNVRADVYPEEVGSVKFEYAYQCYTCEVPQLQPLRTENVAPYALFGNNGNDYHAEELKGGTYFVRATPYSERNAKGKAGAAKDFTIYIYYGPSDNAEASPLLSTSSQIFPNPFVSQTNIEYEAQAAGEWVTIEVYDLQGNRVSRLHDGPVPQGERFSVPFGPSADAQQLYIVRIDNGQKVTSQRIYQQQ